MVQQLRGVDCSGTEKSAAWMAVMRQLNDKVKKTGTLFASKKKGAGVAVIPYIAMFVCAVGSSKMSDWLVKKLSVRRVRVGVECISFLVSGAFLIFAGMVPKGKEALAMFFLTISVGASGFSASAYNVCYVDMSPHYAVRDNL